MTLLLALILACQDPQPAAPDGPPPPAAAPEPSPDTPLGTAAAQDDRHELTGISRPGRAAARHILITYSGSPAAGQDMTRNEHEARRLAESLQARAAAGEDFATLARTHSDDSSSSRGGDLGAFEKGVMVEAFEQAVFALDPDFGVSEVVETPFGFHVIQRYPLEEIRVAQVLIQHADAARSSATRSQDEARALAEQVAARLDAGEDIATLAVELSDGTAGVRGGDLGWFQRGQMLPQFDDAAFSLQPGQHSGVVESSVGFHIIQRLE